MHAHAFALAASALLLVLPLAAACHEEPCDYPVGFCGEYPRQMVTFCYHILNGRYVSATETNTLNLTLPQVTRSGIYPGEAKAYVWKSPVERFVGDLSSPLPTGTVFLESNNFPGLQPRDSRCSVFIWYHEYGCWMAFSSWPMPPDKVVA